MPSLMPWARTEWTRPQAEQILRRLDGVLELLPRAQKQAHERIIDGRPAANGEKNLSLYEPDVRVILRGKAGAEVEFGNTVLLGENRQGLILDFEFFRKSAPADSQLLLGKACAESRRGPGAPWARPRQIAGLPVRPTAARWRRSVSLTGRVRACQQS